MPIDCRCGCGEAFEPSRATVFRIKRGDDVGYLPGHKHRGARNPRWVGGRVMSADGYAYVLRPDHPNALKNGYVAEHRMVMSAHLGRPLRRTECVHHKNEDKADNRIENLELIARGPHAVLHHAGANNVRWTGGPQPKYCAGCGQPFIKTWRTNHGRDKFCTRACMKKALVGANAPNAKLSDAEVAAIRAVSGVLSQRAIAAKFGVSKTQVARILHGQSRLPA